MYQNNYRVKETAYNNIFNPPGATNFTPQFLINSTGITPQRNQPFALLTIDELIVPLVCSVSVFDINNNIHKFSLSTPFWTSGGIFKDVLIQSQYSQSSLVAFDTLINTGGDKQFLLDLNQIDLDASYFNMQQNFFLNFCQNYFDTLDNTPFLTPVLAAGSYNLSYSLTYLSKIK